MLITEPLEELEMVAMMGISSEAKDGKLLLGLVGCLVLLTEGDLVRPLYLLKVVDLALGSGVLGAGILSLVSI